MKLSEATLSDVKAHIGYSSDNQDVLLGIYIEAAISYIKSHTSLEIDELDKYADITVAFLCIVEDMFKNRCATVEKVAHENLTVQTILGLHSRNYL